MSYIQDTFGDQERWVNWKYEEVDGRQTKVPYNAKTGGKAQTNNKSTWSTYSVAKSKSDKIGIILYDDLLIGIDIDHTLTDETALQFVKEANTYTEISPSGNGIRLFLKTETPYKLLRNRKDNFEVYNKGRFLTVTEKPFAQYNLPIRTISHIELTSLLSIVGYPWGQDRLKTEIPYVQGTSSLSDDEVLQKMFSAKNGVKLKSIYDTTQKTGVSELDLSLCIHLAFWCGKDPYQIERIWMSSPIGQRDKTQYRKDYRDDTITKAIQYKQEVYKKPKAPQLKKMKYDNKPKEDVEFTMDMLLTSIPFKIVKGEKVYGDPVYIMNTENICRILRNHPNYKGKLRYDVFSNKAEIYKDNKWEDTVDHESINIQTEISVLFPCFAKVSKLMVEDALTKVMKDNIVNSASDYIKSLTWDGESRLDQWLHYTCGVEDNELYRAIASNWFKGMTQRAIQPGCKFDYILVLEGKQGIKKSSLFDSIGQVCSSNWHLETTMNPNNKDFHMQYQGKLIIELSEGETLSRSETKQLKSIITTARDNYREPYARKSVDHPRIPVFAMTTNDDTYLKDDTGNRRWLPVKVVSEKINVEWMDEHREQLFAEAYHRVFNLKETTWEFPQELLEAEQDERRIEDTNTDIVLDWYRGLTQFERDAGITLRHAFNCTIKNLDTFGKTLDRLEEMRLGGILKGSLKLEKKRTTELGKKVTLWYDVRNLHGGHPVTETVQSVVDKITKDLIKK